MSFTADQLYNLLPAIHRVRDAEQGYPLRQLLDAIADQVAVLEENLEQLYDNHFVETAAPWALPYLGDLLGVAGLTSRRQLTRAEVGHTIAYRRRKGTAAMLEQLARDTTGWPARVVEFFDRLAVTQHLNHVRPANRAFASVRDADALEFFGTPFERATRTVEVRRVGPGRGRWNIPNVGVFLWRLRAYSLTQTPLVADALSPRHFRFHPLGLDAPLFSRPVTEDAPTQLAEPLNLPLPITRRMLKGEPSEAHANQFHPSADYYGSGRSLVIEERAGEDWKVIEADRVLVADLSDVRDGGGQQVVAWAHEAAALETQCVLLDPMLGRVVFPAAPDPPQPPLASFHYGFSSDLGGGEYDRSGSLSRNETEPVQVSHSDPGPASTIEQGLQQLGSLSGAVEIVDSSRYEEDLPDLDAAGRSLEIRAADQRRPTVLPAPPPGLGPRTLRISGDADGSVILDGLLLSGYTIEVNGHLGHLRLRHCTLAPHLVIASDGTATWDDTPALIISAADTLVEIDDCLMGPIRTAPDVRLYLRNSIVDAGATTNVALAGLDGSGFAGNWRLENCTIIGKGAVRVLELASNSILLAELSKSDDPKAWPAPVLVQRRQEGCVRFCWLPRESRVPRRHQCLPRPGGPDDRPSFTSLCYGHPAYGQLGRACPDAVRRGADDESELGAFHDLLQPHREAYVRSRLEEYLRLGLEAGVFFVT